MADTTQAPINGGYPAQHAYPDSFTHAPANVNSAASFQPAPSSTPSNAPANDQKNGISKDEVGWYFVEQYYTNMSRSPEKLHLFYSRRSQLVFGTEAETVQVAVGQKAINDKIKQLDFQDCKVRVLNVDSQASFDNILISVIGEISNRSEPSRKFVQTFVLAEQPNGYYVLNDIFRYLPEAETVPEPEKAQVDSEPAAAQVDEKLEEAEQTAEAKPVKEDAPQTNGTAAQETPVEAAPEAAAPVETEAPKAEKPATPEPTPVPEQKEAPAPAKESAPARAVPKTWATIASKSGASAPVVPAVPVAPTAGHDHKKTQSRAGEENVLAYIKNVTEKVDASLLKQTLSRFGKLKHFDVSRAKNCAFVEFGDAAGYAAAVAANPHQIGTEQIYVEERRPRTNAFGNGSYGAGRGGAGRGRGDRAGSQGRGGFQREGRGGFAPRGRGGNVNAKGRNQAQTA
ncbi:RNA recognition motif family protein [Aspergillus niger]|uniref:RNA recognition motif family protein n=1 Tax=Aspergillus niger TaxID=5061 RepID=A0A505I4Q6_ASPNG|nr:RNA recognition motif family protein [Aspergillus niger]